MNRPVPGLSSENYDTACDLAGAALLRRVPASATILQVTEDRVWDEFSMAVYITADFENVIRYVGSVIRSGSAGDPIQAFPGLAMLLTVAREKPWSSFPAERMPDWYGWSADTAEQALRDLLALGLAERREAYRRTPLSPTGSTLTYQYRLKPWLRPKAAARPGAGAS